MTFSGVKFSFVVISWVVLSLVMSPLAKSFPTSAETKAAACEVPDFKPYSALGIEERTHWPSPAMSTHAP